MKNTILIMKYLNKTLISLSALSLATCFNIQAAQATSVYTGTVDLSLLITDITNQSDTSLSYGNDIKVFTSLEIDENSNSIVPELGGSVTPTLPTPQSATTEGQTLLNNFDFSQSMQVDGSVSNGDISSYYYTETLLTFENTSLFDYTISYTVDYNLSVTASGDAGATASIAVENLGIPDDYLEVGTSSDSLVLAETPTVSIFLAAGHIVELFAAVEFSASASATSPVPVPGAVWLFLAGLLALPKFKQS